MTRTTSGGSSSWPSSPPRSPDGRFEINAFDQPNVQEAKDATKRVLDSGSIPQIESAGDDALGRCCSTPRRRTTSP